MSDNKTLLRFGVFEADLRSGELRRKGLRVRLQEQPFQVLTMLAERPGDVITREELRLKLWPSDTFVDFDHGLNTTINKLRDALGDSASNPRFIETLPRRGYRFLAPVQRVNGTDQPADAPSTSVPPWWPGTDSPPQAGAPPLSRPLRRGGMQHERDDDMTPPTSAGVPEGDRSPSATRNSEPGTAVVGTRDSELSSEIPHAPRTVTRTLFSLTQLMYLVFYAVALFRLDHLHEGLPDQWVVPVMVAIVITAPLGIALRLYLLSAVAFDYAQAGANFLKLFRFIFVLDVIWALAPFLITIYIGVGGAIAACAALVYLPFSQRTLLRMAYRDTI